MHASRQCLLLSLWVTLSLGCEIEQPVLTGIPDQAILAPKPTDGAATPKKASVTYEKSPDVWVDARLIGGKHFTRVRDLIADQLGSLQSSKALDGTKGRELAYERGTIRVAKGTIYMLRVPLPYPMRRTEALEKLGFPPYVGGYINSHREYRLHNEWGFRRIRLRRESRRSERVTQVEAWRWIPGERGLGR